MKTSGKTLASGKNPASGKSMASGKTLAVLLLTAALVFGSVVYYFNSPQNGLTEKPPTLTIDTGESLYLGKISKETACDQRLPGHQWIAQDVTDYVAPASEAAYRLKIGDHFYHADRSFTVGEIIESIQPVAGNKVLLAYYDPNYGNFKTYPSVDRYAALSLNDEIYRNHVFVLISCEESQIYDIKGETIVGDLPTELYTLDKTWVLVPQTDGNIEEDLFPFKSKLVSAFYQDGEGYDFARLDSEGDAADLNPAYKTMWLKFDSGLVAADREAAAEDEEEAQPDEDEEIDEEDDDEEETPPDEEEEDSGRPTGRNIPLKEQTKNIICLQYPELCDPNRGFDNTDSAEDDDTAGESEGSAENDNVLPAIEDLDIAYGKTEIDYDGSTKLILTSYPTATLTWPKPENDDDITLYEIYHQRNQTVEAKKLSTATTSKGPYTGLIASRTDSDSGKNIKSVTIYNLTSGTHWFSIVAIDKDGTKSTPSRKQFTFTDERSKLPWVEGPLPPPPGDNYNKEYFRSFTDFEVDDEGYGDGYDLLYTYMALPEGFFDRFNVLIQVKGGQYNGYQQISRKYFDGTPYATYPNGAEYPSSASGYIKELVDDYIDVGTDWIYPGDEDDEDSEGDIEKQPPFYAVIDKYEDNENDYLLLSNFHDETGDKKRYYGLKFTAMDKTNGTLKSQVLDMDFEIGDI